MMALALAPAHGPRKQRPFVCVSRVRAIHESRTKAVRDRAL